MKKIFKVIGVTFIILGIVFFLSHSFLVVKDRNESFSRDIFGLPIPTPPMWTSFIPYVGFWIGILFESLSWHGLVGLGGSLVLFSIGASFLMGTTKKQNQNKPLLKPEEKSRLRRLLVDALQEAEEQEESGQDETKA